MWKISEIESGIGSEPATWNGAAHWLSRPTPMVLAAAGATSTMAQSVRVSDMVRFCGHVAGCNCWRIRLQPTVTRPTRSVGACLFIACLYSVMSIYIVVGGVGVFVILNILLIFLEIGSS